MDTRNVIQINKAALLFQALEVHNLAHLLTELVVLVFPPRLQTVTVFGMHMKAEELLQTWPLVCAK